MLRPLPKLAALLLLALTLVGCSESLTDSASVPTFAAAMKGYDKALNADQEKAAVAELQGEQTKHQGEGVGQDSTPR